MSKRDELGSEKVEHHDAICEDLDHIFFNNSLDKAGKHQLLY